MVAVRAQELERAGQEGAAQILAGQPGHERPRLRGAFDRAVRPHHARAQPPRHHRRRDREPGGGVSGGFSASRMRALRARRADAPISSA